MGNNLIKEISTPFSVAELYTYRSLFLSRSKPASHFKGMANLDDKTIEEKCPEPLKALIDRSKKIIAPASIIESEI